jgi:uncharacterized protein YcbK (DUF882 family)
MDEKIGKSRQTRISRRRMIKVSAAAAAATIVIPRLALADDWIRVDSVPMTSAVPGRSSIMRWKPNKAPAQTQYQPLTAPGQFQTVRYTPTRSYTGETRSLSIYNTHTGERLNTVYCENGRYVPEALREVDFFFRDFRANLVKQIDPRLLDLLHTIHQSSDTSKPFNLVSGYRSPQTNAMLAMQYEGVARHSMHIEGKAADINLPGRQLSLLQRVALALRYGGVGYYPQSGFVHVDTGRVRRWG